jgi:hypothetical protein
MKNKLFKLFALLFVCSSLAIAQQPINLIDVGGTALAAVTAYGTAPSGNVIGTNAYITNTPAVTGSGVFEVGPTTSANTASNTFFTNISDGTHALSAAVSAWGTAPTGTEVLGINADLFINGVVASAAASGVQKVGIVGNAGAVFDAAGQNASSAPNEVLVGAQYNSSPTSITSGNMSPLQMDSTGHLLVNCSGCSAASTVSLVPETTGGLSAKHFVAAASDNATNLKSSAGQVYSIDGYNNGSAPVYFKLYNASSTPTGCGATNLFKVVGLQAGTQHTLQSEEGWALGTGIGYCLTGGIADSDDTAVTASVATIDVGYK